IMAKKLKPLGNKVIVQRSEAKVSKGGILLPEAAQEKPKQGVVIAVGPGKTNDKGKLEPIEIKPGDQVLFSSYAGTEYKQDEETLLIVSEDDILAIVK
ncbi:MAG: hypothetical protein RL235_676, partial [Chlamydiota bacterium]